MSLKRGAFILKCDYDGCDNVIELETEEFEEAKSIANDEMDSNGWTNMRQHGKFADICDRH